jgi:hypothetical protein
MWENLNKILSMLGLIDAALISLVLVFQLYVYPVLKIHFRLVLYNGFSITHLGEPILIIAIIILAITIIRIEHGDSRILEAFAFK